MGLCYPKGLFIDESQGIYVIMPKTTVSKLTGAKDKVNTIYMKLKDNTTKQKQIDSLRITYKDCIVKESLTKEDLSQAMSGITTPMKLVSIFVILMSAFIIFTSITGVLIYISPRPVYVSAA